MVIPDRRQPIDCTDFRRDSAEISNLSTLLVFHSLPIFFVRHLDFRDNSASDKDGTNTNTVEVIDHTDPENIVFDTRIMLVSRRILKVQVSATLLPPGLS